MDNYFEFLPSDLIEIVLNCVRYPAINNLSKIIDLAILSNQTFWLNKIKIDGFNTDYISLKFSNNSTLNLYYYSLLYYSELYYKDTIKIMYKFKVVTDLGNITNFNVLSLKGEIVTQGELDDIISWNIGAKLQDGRYNVAIEYESEKDYYTIKYTKYSYSGDISSFLVIIRNPETIKYLLIDIFIFTGKRNISILGKFP